MSNSKGIMPIEVESKILSKRYLVLKSFKWSLTSPFGPKLVPAPLVVTVVVAIGHSISPSDLCKGQPLSISISMAFVSSTLSTRGCLLLLLSKSPNG